MFGYHLLFHIQMFGLFVKILYNEGVTLNAVGSILEYGNAHSPHRLKVHCFHYILNIELVLEGTWATSHIPCPLSFL